MKKRKKVLGFLCMTFFAILIRILLPKIIETRYTPGKTEDEKIVIGFAMDTLVHERWLRDRDIFVAKANELGAEVIVQTANSNSNEQEKQVEYLLKQDIDVLVLVPHDAELAADIVKSAKSKGVKVISYDRLVKKADVDLYISFDNIKVGQLMAQAVVEVVPTGNYLIMNGSQLDYNSSMFNEGYHQVLDEQIARGKIQIVEETWIKDWLYEDAFQYMDEILGKGLKIDAIIAGNDTLAAAVIHALAERRLAGNLAVIGHDADLDGCQRIVEGTQIATIYKPIDELAKATAEYAVLLAKGGLIQAKDTIDDGKYQIPYYKIDPILVTKENMMEIIIENKFHAKEDVYMNVPKSQWPSIESKK